MPAIENVEWNIPEGSRPTGTITFLFTDVEGSTQLWEHHAAWMEQAHRRHEAILREAIAAHGGWAYKQIGDSFQAAFQTASAALAAAVAAQQSLAAEGWGEPGPLKVRMGLYTGTAEQRAHDYFGPLLNRVHRLMSAGHGGQILLTAPPYELVRDHLPSGVALRDLGERRLKDLIRPEQVYQVVVEGLAADFLPLRTLDARPNNLPPQPNAFIGREDQIAAVTTLLRRPQVRLLTLIGPGGTGKTRLALQVAAELVDKFAQGVWFVNLAPIRDPELVLATIAATLGVKEQGDAPLLETLQAALRDKQLLLILDNCEQVVASASQVAELLEAAPRLRILATSRAPLGTYGEQEFPVPPLELPPSGGSGPTDGNRAVGLGQYEAVRLFIERARAVKPDFTITNDTAPAVAEICARLDGLPLAIELAAARIRLLPPGALLARLGARLAVLTGGPRSLPARQQTLRATIEWSYNLLTAGEQQLFRRLAVFQGGRTLTAIDVICNGDRTLAVDVLDGVEALVDHSLLGTQPGQDGESRFVMLETIHEYAAEMLGTTGEAPDLRNRHFTFFLNLAEQAAPGLRGSTQTFWLARLHDEQDNLRTALTWAATSGQAESGLRLAATLGLFWLVHGDYSEGRTRLATLLNQPGATTPPSGATRAAALHWAGALAYYQGDYPASRVLLKESLTLRRQAGEKPVDERGIAETLVWLACLDDSQQEYFPARDLLEDALQTAQQAQDKHGYAFALMGMGELLRLEGDVVAARALYEQSLALYRELGDKRQVAVGLMNLGLVALRERDSRHAATFFKEALVLATELDNKYYMASCLAYAAAVRALRNELHPTAQLFGAA